MSNLLVGGVVSGLRRALLAGSASHLRHEDKIRPTQELIRRNSGSVRLSKQSSRRGRWGSCRELTKEGVGDASLARACVCLWVWAPKHFFLSCL